MFSGDVGRPTDPVMKPPDEIDDIDYLIIESTYGDRRHPEIDLKKALTRAIEYAIKRGGVVLIPSFAVGRAQTIMYLLSQLSYENKLENIPIFLDSPMAINATQTFCQFGDEHRLSREDCQRMCERVRYTQTVEASKAIASQVSPKIIIASSGMLTGGRVLHHLKRYLGRRENVIVFVGYQAAGTRGAALQAGAQSVKIHGDYYPVRAKLVSIDALSAHADFTEMINWLSTSKKAPKQTFIVHGEPHSQDAFRRHLMDSLGWQSVIPSQGDRFNLE